MPLVPENFLMSIRKTEHLDWKFFFYDEFTNIFIDRNGQNNEDILNQIKARSCY